MVNLMFHYFCDPRLNRNSSAKLMHDLRIIEEVPMNITKCNEVLLQRLNGNLLLCRRAAVAYDAI